MVHKKALVPVRAHGGQTMERVSTLIIGSGFGGAVMACRLAENGAQVGGLERGRHWLTAHQPHPSQRVRRGDQDQP